MGQRQPMFSNPNGVAAVCCPGDMAGQVATTCDWHYARLVRHSFSDGGKRPGERPVLWRFGAMRTHLVTATDGQAGLPIGIRFEFIRHGNFVDFEPVNGLHHGG